MGVMGAAMGVIGRHFETESPEAEARLGWMRLRNWSEVELDRKRAGVSWVSVGLLGLALRPTETSRGLELKHALVGSGCAIVDVVNS